MGKLVFYGVATLSFPSSIWEGYMFVFIYDVVGDFMILYTSSLSVIYCGVFVMVSLSLSSWLNVDVFLFSTFFTPSNVLWSFCIASLLSWLNVDVLIHL